MKRKILSLVLCGCLVVGMLPAMALADDSQNTATSPVVTAEEAATSGECGPNLTWTYDQETQTLTISGTGEMWDYGTWENRPDWVNLPFVHVVLEKGVTSIGADAFYGCSNLTDIIIPQGVTTIGEWAFYECSSLTEVVIPQGVTTIGERTFSDCYSLTKVVIPRGVTTIGDGAFSYCDNLTEIDIPAGVTSIGGNAFYGCDSLTNVDLPATLSTIGGNAFAACTSLTEIVIPEGVTTIGAGAFSVTGLIEIVIPEGVTTIGDRAFSDCLSLTKIVLNQGVTTIGDSAFSGCYRLTEIVLPQGVTTIGDSAFYACTGLKKIIIPEGVTTIGDSAFYECLALTEIALPTGLKTIGNSAFYNCISLTKITLPQSLTTIGDSAFPNSHNLNTIVFGGTKEEWKVLDTGNTGYTPYLVAVVCADGTIPVSAPTGSCGDNLTWRYDRATQTLAISGTGDMWDYDWENRADWMYFQIDHAVVEEGVTSIGAYAFYSCTSLTSVDLPVGLTSIEASAFAACENLTAVNLPAGLTSINDYAFSCCTNLSEIRIPDSVDTIGISAFYECLNLTAVNYTGSQEQWEAISIDEGNEVLTSATIHYNYDPNQPELTPEPTPEPTQKPQPTPTPAPQDKVDVTVSGDKVETTVGGVELVLDNAGKVFENGTTITVEKITQGTIYDTVKKALEKVVAKMDNTAIFEFTATKDGKVVQPDGALSVTFDIPKVLTASNLKMFYVDENGKYEEVQITVDTKAGTVTANLTHFSTYVLANVAPVSGGNTVPPTGDTSALTLYVWGLTMAMAGLTLLLVHKRRA